MKARNKFERNIYELRDQLGEITKKHKDFCKSKMKNYVTFKYKSHVCTECHHRWKGNLTHTKILKNITCPNCKKELEALEFIDAYNKVSKYIGIFTTHKGYQIFRLLYIEKILHTKDKPKIFINEVTQFWINEKGRSTHLRKLISSGYNSIWNLFSELEVRGGQTTYNYYSTNTEDIVPDYYYPIRKFIPIVKRNGFTTKGHLIAPNFLMQELLKDNITETLIKTKQYSLLKKFVYGSHSIITDWNKQIVIALRHNYIVNDANSWIDHLRLLDELKMDTHNPKYICPDNFQQQHMELSNKVNTLRVKIERIKKVEKNRINNSFMKKRIDKLKKLKIEDNEIEIRQFTSENQVKQEGNLLNHCIYSSRYHLKKNSIIFSARVNREITETVDFSLKTGRVKTSRGHNNMPSVYNERIIELVNKNSRKIINALN